MNEVWIVTHNRSVVSVHETEDLWKRWTVEEDR